MPKTNPVDIKFPVNTQSRLLQDLLNEGWRLYKLNGAWRCYREVHPTDTRRDLVKWPGELGLSDLGIRYWLEVTAAKLRGW